MSRWLALALVVMAGCGGEADMPAPAAAPQAVRAVQSLDGAWRFKADPDDVGQAGDWYAVDADDSTWQPITVPGAWNYLYRDTPVPGAPNDYDGVGWYRTRFAAGEGDGVRVLRFGAVNYHAMVWLNGTFLGEHEGDFLPFELPVGDHISAAEDNVLAVRVETINTHSNLTVPPALMRYDYWIFSGVHRGVTLETLPAVSVHDIFARGAPVGDSASVDVTATVLNAGADPIGLDVRVSVLSATDDAVLASASSPLHAPGAAYTEVTLQLTVPGAASWSPDHPVLHRAHVELIPAAALGEPAPSIVAYKPGAEPPLHAALSAAPTDGLDAAEVRFGVREITVEGRRIFVNGEPIVFRGVNRHDEYPMAGRTLTEAQYRADLAQLKAANVNAIRTAHYPNAPMIYDLADELGFLVCEEIPAIALTHEEMETDEVLALSLDYMARMVIRDRNHPSIVIWSAGDEPEPVGHDDFNSALYAKAKSLDPTRLVTYARIHYDNMADDPDADVVMLNPYFGWYTGAPSHLEGFLEATAGRFVDKPIVLGEFGAGAVPGSRHPGPNPAEAPQYTEDFQADYLQQTWAITRDKDYMSGGFIWLAADFISPTREHLRSSEFPADITPNPVPFHNLKGIVDRNRVPKNAFLTTAGMFADAPLHHLRLEVQTDSGTPIAAAAVDMFLEDGTRVAAQTSDDQGVVVLWHVPPWRYTVEVRAGDHRATETIEVDGDLTVELTPR